MSSFNEAESIERSHGGQKMLQPAPKVGQTARQYAGLLIVKEQRLTQRFRQYVYCLIIGYSIKSLSKVTVRL